MVIAYFVGLGLALLIKIGYFIYNRDKSKFTWLGALVHFFFADGASAGATLGTFAIGWVVIGIYVGDIQAGMAEYIGSLPKHPAVAFLLGVAMESAAPPLFKAFISRVSGSMS